MEHSEFTVPPKGITLKSVITVPWKWNPTELNVIIYVQLHYPIERMLLSITQLKNSQCFMEWKPVKLMYGTEH